MRHAVFFLMVILIVLCSGCTLIPPARDNVVVIGVMPFNEQYILGEAISQILEKEGYETRILSGLNNNALYEGVKSGQVDIYVDYTSSIYYQLPDKPRIDRWEPDQVYTIVKDSLAEEGVVLAGRAGFRNDNIIVVPSEWAKERNVTSISDLAPYAGEMVFGSDLVFHAAKEDGLPHLEEVYGFSFREVRPMDPALTFPALQSGQVDAIVAYSTDSRIDLFNLTGLEDDRFALPPYHAIFLVHGERAKDEKFMSALEPLIEGIDSGTMRELNSRFDVDKQDPGKIAREFLALRGLL
jgi:osmoprotectant transport system substrate-binding protein